jgi:RNA polymerase sigma factor (sigma-70 family)
MPHPLLRFLFAAPAGDPVADAELLARFARHRDEAAFELLVRRHAGSVWKVCRGVLRREADAEDAFQATFLALSKQAGRIRSGCVAGWLHRVAVHTALKLRAKAARLPAVLGEVAAPADSDPETAAAVHEEVARLGESYRLPVVLCDLQGHTHAEAAKVLGWPVGTVSGRLSRARDQLRRRLARRGLAPAAVLASSAGEAPGTLIRTVVSGVPSPAVVTLTEGVLSAMRTAKLKVFALIVGVGVGLAGTGVMVAVSQEKKPADPEAPRAEAGKPDPAWNKADEVPSVFPELKFRVAPNALLDTDEIVRFTEAEQVQVLVTEPPLTKLAKARLNTVLRAIAFNLRIIRDGGIPRPFGVEGMHHLADQIGRDGQQAVAAAFEVYDRREDRRRWLEFQVKYQKYVEGWVAMRADPKVGVMSSSALMYAQQRRLDAEIALLKFDQQK